MQIPTDVSRDMSDEDGTTQKSPDAPTGPLSRRGFGKQFLLGASALAVLFASSKPEEVEAAPLTDTWKLGGNTGVNTDGTNFLGTTNVAPLIFKTAQTVGSPIERMRILPTGNVGIGTATPTSAKLQVHSTTYAVFGRHTATSGAQPGVYGDTFATVANASGVQGVVKSTVPGADSAGILGQNSGTNGNGTGVRGSHAGSGSGVHGTSVKGTGVRGESASTTAGANGVEGRLTATATGSDAAGVRGVSPNGTGVKGEGYIAVHGVGGSYGVYAYGTSYGLYASSTNTGVYGYGPEVGVLGETNTGTGVRGVSYSDSYSASAVYGEAFGANNNGVYGEANNGSSAYGVYGRSSSGYAGYFSGKVTVTGTLSKPAGSFQIDHPLAPDTKYLYHSFVESPDMMNVYNGNVATDAQGNATVEMPDWFEALNRDFRYQLTVIGQFAQAIVAREITNNRFSIKTDKPNVKVSWQVTGIRQDAFANANRIPVEEDKPEKERGTYLHPKEHGKPESAGVDADRFKKRDENDPKRDPAPPGPQRTPPPKR